MTDEPPIVASLILRLTEAEVEAIANGEIPAAVTDAIYEEARHMWPILQGRHPLFSKEQGAA